MALTGETEPPQQKKVNSSFNWAPTSRCQKPAFWRWTQIWCYQGTLSQVQKIAVGQMVWTLPAICWEFWGVWKFPQNTPWVFSQITEASQSGKLDHWSLGKSGCSTRIMFSPTLILGVFWIFFLCLYLLENFYRPSFWWGLDIVSPNTWKPRGVSKIME